MKEQLAVANGNSDIEQLEWEDRVESAFWVLKCTSKFGALISLGLLSLAMTSVR